MKLSELKKIIREVISEEIAYHGVEVLTVPDEQFSVQISREGMDQWKDVKEFPDFESANLQMIKYASHHFPAKYRVIGTKTKNVFAEKEVLK